MLFFFSTHTQPTEIYTLSLHDALPISHRLAEGAKTAGNAAPDIEPADADRRDQAGDGQPDHQDDAGIDRRDRKSTRLNSSHRCISYAVFCLKKKKNKKSISD